VIIWLKEHTSSSINRILVLKSELHVYWRKI